jgi:hypothetical protein
LFLELREIADATTFAWVEAAVAKVDKVSHLLRRNLQKIIALDGLVVELGLQNLVRD